MSKVWTDSYRVAEWWVVSLLVSGISRRKDNPPSLCCWFQDCSVHEGLAYRILQWSLLRLWSSPRESEPIFSMWVGSTEVRMTYKDPWPALEASSPVHKINTVRQQSRECTFKLDGEYYSKLGCTGGGVTWRCGCSEEDGKAALQHVFRIPHRKARRCISGEKRKSIGGKLTSMQLPDKSHFLRSQDKSVQRPIEGICSFMSKGSAGSASMLTSLQSPWGSLTQVGELDE